MKIYKSVKVPVGDGQVLQPIPQVDIAEADPFLLLHHAEKTEIEPGGGFYVGPHPHRGFQPISFVYDGEIHHKDSLGNDSVVKTNGVQWINAARGLMHSEGISKDFKEKGGDFEFIQLWVNLPSNQKLSMPKYYGVNDEDMGRADTANSEIRVVSGSINGVSGPIDNGTHINSAMVKSNERDTLELEFSGNTKLVYVLSGKVEVNGEELSAKELGQVHNVAELEISVLEPSRLLVLGGDKIEEPVKAWGPYVMNTQTEIMEALRDFQAGKMGYLTA